MSTGVYATAVPRAHAAPQALRHQSIRLVDRQSVLEVPSAQPLTQTGLEAADAQPALAACGLPDVVLDHVALPPALERPAVRVVRHHLLATVGAAGAVPLVHES